jgi:catechol 2,3-dioxygenase-like lactoylglutathione lyase family enzyme
MKRARAFTITPLLVVSDLQRPIDFYCGKLGFGEPSVWGEPPCFAMLPRDWLELKLSVQEEPGGVKPNGPSGMWDFYLRIEDVASEIEALKAAGVPLDKGPTDMFYEMREIEVVDPDGYRICLAEDLANPDQNALDMPVDSVSWDGNTLPFEMKAIGAAFAGHADGETGGVKGMWSQHGRSWPLHLMRG